MLRLLIISRSSNPRGGADRIIADLCRGLPAYDWDVTLGLTKGLRFNRPELYQDEYPGLPVVEIDGTRGTQSARVRAIEACIAEIRPDVVLTMRVYDAYAAVDAYRRRTSDRRPRLVVGVRAFEAPYFIDLRRNASMVDGCITSGKLIASTCHSFSGIDQKRVFSIAGGVQLPKTIRDRHNVQVPLRLLYAGRLEQSQKRVHDLVPFVERLSASTDSFVLTIVGDGPEESSLKDRLKKWIATDQVRFCGWQDQQTLYEKYFPEADIFVHFAAWEGVTIAPREAMVHGVVPVISDFTGRASEGQFVDGRNSLVFPVADTEQAVRCVRRLQDDPGLYAELSRNAARSQMGEYTATGAIAKWDASLRAILDQPPVVGDFQAAPNRTPHRQSTSAKIKSFARAILRRRVVHGDPGSEWPTNSGYVTTDEVQQIDLITKVSTGDESNLNQVITGRCAGSPVSQ
jgi:glycosyltransferase involved in cell wall biosynthesis